jgi:hypothetical protein
MSAASWFPSELWLQPMGKQFILVNDKKKIRVHPREFAMGALRNREWV